MWKMQKKNVYVVFAQIISLVNLRLKNIAKRFAIVVSTGKSRREKPMAKDWCEIQSDFDRMQSMSCVPIGLRKVPENHVFDENKSVKWNRDKVAENNLAYKKEFARLHTLKNKARDSIYEDIYLYIQDEVGHVINRDCAIKIWEYAYKKGHSYGVYQIKHEFDEAIALIEDILRIITKQEVNEQ